MNEFLGIHVLYTDAHKGQRLACAFLYPSLYHHCLYYLSWSLSPGSPILSWVGWAASSGIVLSQGPSTGMTCMGLHAWLSCGCWGPELTSSWFCDKALS